MSSVLAQASPIRADLEFKVIRANRRAEAPSLLTRFFDPKALRDKLAAAPLSFWRRMYLGLLRSRTIPTITFAAFLADYVFGSGSPATLGLVTSVGANYMAGSYVALNGQNLSAINWHDWGIGTAGENVTDEGLQIPVGTARVQGSQSNPAANQYRSVATIVAVGPVAVSEWTLNSAATLGVCFDRRVFTAQGLDVGDAIQFTYTLTQPAGGS